MYAQGMQWYWLGALLLTNLVIWFATRTYWKVSRDAMGSLFAEELDKRISLQTRLGIANQNLENARSPIQTLRSRINEERQRNLEWVEPVTLEKRPEVPPPKLPEDPQISVWEHLHES